MFRQYHVMDCHFRAVAYAFVLYNIGENKTMTALTELDSAMFCIWQIFRLNGRMSIRGSATAPCISHGQKKANGFVTGSGKFNCIRGISFIRSRRSVRLSLPICESISRFQGVQIAIMHRPTFK